MVLPNTVRRVHLELGRAPQLCLPPGQEAHWRKFDYGLPPYARRGATPVNASLAKFLSDDADQNARLMIAVAEYGDVSEHMINIPSWCNDRTSEEDADRMKEAMDRFKSTPARVPFQIELSESYSFRPDNCGRFDPSVKQCWQALEQGPYHPNFILTVDGDEENCCKKQPDGTYDCNTNRTDTNLSRRPPASFYDVRSLCPNHHQLCGSVVPPNFPDSLRACHLPADYRWVQVPITASVVTSLPPTTTDSTTTDPTTTDPTTTTWETTTGLPPTTVSPADLTTTTWETPASPPLDTTTPRLNAVRLPSKKLRRRAAEYKPSKRGVLPEGLAPGMQWIQAHKNSEICKAYDLEEAGRLVEIHEQELGRGRLSDRMIGGCPNVRISEKDLASTVTPRKFITQGTPELRLSKRPADDPGYPATQFMRPEGFEAWDPPIDCEGEEWVRVNLLPRSKGEAYPPPVFDCRGGSAASGNWGSPAAVAAAVVAAAQGLRG